MNTQFKQAKEIRYWTWEWESPDLLTHNQIDYILVNTKLLGAALEIVEPF